MLVAVRSGIIHCIVNAAGKSKTAGQTAEECNLDKHLVGE